MWKAQVLPAIRGAMLQGHLDGTMQAPPRHIEEKVADKVIKKPNPEYARSTPLDQQLLSYLFMSRVMAGVQTLESSAQVWRALDEKGDHYPSQITSLR
jgi:hypothetical protein